ncbi:recombinase family protein [Schleiferiaceae bacterium]|jgi:DNA invertase Pin-like site-specific DNA recombinase/iron-sulfur cluster repair protein YtfE (RIC family)|nr:recombinase family protein [Schleiferiaceae bacterium]
MSKENIGILLRVSSDIQQNEGGGLEVQKKMGLEMSKKLGYKPIIFNEGSQSSFKVEINERVKLVELLDEVGRGTIKNIWVFNTDRLGRNTQSWMSIYKVLIEYGVKVFVGTSPKPFDLDNPLDNLNMNMLSLISQYDNQLRRMRSVMGKRNSLKSGNTFVGGTKPFGYDVKNKRLIPNDGEKKVVNHIFKMYKEGKSTIEIKLYLDTKTEYSPKRSKDGWNLGTIQKMLGNSLYKGIQKWEWKEMVGGKSKVVETISVKTPQIVPTKLWNEVQLKLLENQKHKVSEKNNDSILDGLIYCKSCGVKLSIRSGEGRNNLYSCRSVEYKWKNPSKWGDKHKNCSLKRSMRVEETDTKILNHIISVIKESKSVRENYKIKHLNPKFDKVGNVKKETHRRIKYINDKKRILKQYEENIIDIEVQILTNHIDKGKGKRMIEKISNMRDELNNDINHLEEELFLYTNTSKWIDWLNKMYLEIDSVLDYPLEKKKEFLKDYLKVIDVEYLTNEKSHRLNFVFKYPIIDDKLTKLGKDKKGMTTYQIEDGMKSSTYKLKLKPTHKSKVSTEEREELNQLISNLRIEKSLSLNQICKEINDRGFRTPTNKEWNKSLLSLHIKKMNVDVGK